MLKHGEQGIPKRAGPDMGTSSALVEQTSLLHPAEQKEEEDEENAA